jgi:hypothetical protein
MNVPNYLFEHEDVRVTSWHIDGPRLRRDRFAYLILPSDENGVQRRALVLVDNYKNPTKALFLEGARLMPVPEVKGRPLSERIDYALSDRALLIDPNGTVTANIELDSNYTEQIKLRFSSALKDARDKLDIPCLTLPDVLTLSLREKSFELVILLAGEKANATFRSTCGEFADRLPPPAFSYVEAARLHFAFTKKRLVILQDRYVVSIPYNLNDEAIDHSPILVAKTQLDRILNDFRNVSNDSGASAETPGAQAMKEAVAAQRSIDAALIGLLKAKGEKH